MMRRAQVVAGVAGTGVLSALSLPAFAGLIRRTLHDDVLFEPPPRPPFESWTAPDAAGRRTLEIRGADGVTLRGWLYRNARSTAPALIYFYGNGDSIANSAARALRLRDLGCSVALFDYRGYGYSDGTPHLATIAGDALAEYDAVSAQFDGRPLFVYGSSLGTVFAVRVAVARAIRGLILQAPPASAAEELAALRLPTVARTLFTLVPDASIVDGVANASRIAAYRGPLLVLHGTDDEVVPIRQGREVFEACPSAHKRFVALAGLHHNDVSLAPGAAGGPIAEFVGQYGHDAMNL